MLKVFGQTDKTFTTNGDVILRPLRAKVRKEDNGSFHLDLQTGIEYADYLVEGNIVVANTPQGDQAFRISNPTKTRTKITVKAKHVFYDSENLLIADSYVVDKNCNDALDHLNSATDITSPFTTLSDVGSVNSYRCVRTSLYEAIKTVLERWGGHLVRDNYNIQIRTQIGQDNGVVVRYAKNLKDITCDENWSGVVTKLLPVGKDGTLLNAVDGSADLYVYSSVQYSIPYTKTVTFTQEIKRGDYESDEAYMQALVDDLALQAQEYVDANCIPQVNYTLSANLERVTDIGDTIHVYDSRLGVNLTTNLIAYDYDCILDKYTSLEFGNFQKTLSGLVNNITSSVESNVNEQLQSVTVTLGQELQDATDKIMGVLGDSYVVYEGNRILVLDKLPKEEATNVIMINNGGIGFSQTGINGTFNSAWAIDGTMNMQQINVINFVADLIKGGTLKLGGTSAGGILELYDESNALIGVMDKYGLKMYGVDGSYVLMNNQVGFAGYDRNNNQIYWVNKDEFHMKKSVVEEEITLCNRLRFIPITIMEGGNVVNDGIGLVSVAGVT